MEVSIYCKECPLPPSVSLHGLDSVVADGSIHISWWRRGPEQHDEGRAEGGATNILWRGDRNCMQKEEKVRLLYKISKFLQSLLTGLKGGECDRSTERSQTCHSCSCNLKGISAILIQSSEAKGGECSVVNSVWQAKDLVFQHRSVIDDYAVQLSRVWLAPADIGSRGASHSCHWKPWGCIWT